MIIIQFIRGFLMASADSVPGVSGGTVAFILGFYDKFIGSINDLISGSKEQRIEAISFLFKIGVGWVVGLVLSILFIASIFEEHIYQISSVFLGLIILSIPFIISQEKVTLTNSKKYEVIFVVSGILVVFLITYFNPLTSSGASGNELSFVLLITVFIAGMVAISAMVLPGISGSTVLLIMGLYGTIIQSIKELLGFDFSYFTIVFVFGLGVIVGVLLTVKGVKYTLSHHRSKTIYTIIGLMIGSIYAVIMGPRSLEIPKPPMSIQTFSILYFILGSLIIVGLHYLSEHLKKKS